MSNPFNSPVSAPQEFHVESLLVRVFSTQPEMARAAALSARDVLRDALAGQGAAAAIFAAANSQAQSLDALVALDGVDWSKLSMFHMDEYLGLDGNHRASFRRFLRERVEQRVRPRVFHCIDGQAHQPEAECERYARLLAAQPIDLCLLGIGENGHLAFNDPHVANFSDPHAVKLVKLDEASRQQQVGEGHFLNLAAVPQFAYTLTLPALCAARKMICIVPEGRKAQAVRDALRGPVTTECPASLLRRQPQCILFLDADSAALL